MNKPILAQYSIRSKQAYIFQTNRLLEVVGASAIIAKTFRELRKQAANAGVRVREAEGTPFSMDQTLAAFRDGEYEAVELFVGGGNDTILFKDRASFIAVNKAYTRCLLEHYPGLWPMCVGVEIEKRENGYYQYSDIRDPSDPQKTLSVGDYHRLMDETERVKSRMTDGRVSNALPFSMPDRTTYQPYSAYQVLSDGKGTRKIRLTSASLSKRQNGTEDDKTIEDVRMLDDMVFEKGKESLLAIVHADGNDLGIKILRKLSESKSGEADSEEEKAGYDHCVTVMRGFSAEIDRVFCRLGKEAVEKELKALRDAAPEDKKSFYKIRWIVTDGDDLTFLCNARLAKKLTEAYLRRVSSISGANGERYSACAGICVFHSHYPFARAYDLAEQACDSAKKPVHKTAIGPNGTLKRPEEQSWMDFQIVRGGVYGALDEIRDLHQTEACMMRPWRVCSEGEEDERDLAKLDQLADLLRACGVARTSIKTFGMDFEIDKARGELDWKRLLYNTKSLTENSLMWTGEKLLQALYDLSEFYDIWYAKGES